VADTINKQGLFGSNVPGLLDRGIASLYDRDTLVGLENEFGSQYGVQNTASGPASDARHMAAMNNLSNTLSNSGLGIAMGLPSELAGDVAAFGAGLINELPALGRGFSAQNLGEIKEDIAANFRGSFGTPNTATARGIYEDVFSRAAPQTVRGGPFANYGAAQAAPSIQAAIDRARAQDFIDARAETKNQSPATFGLPDPTDRFGRAPVEEAFEMIGGRAVPVGDVLGRQMALEKADFVEETPTGLASLVQNINPLGLIAGLINPALGFAVNMGSRARSGLGSLGRGMSGFNRAMRGYNPMTGRTNTQAEYEQARADRQLNNRLDYMLNRKKKGKSYSKKNLAKVQAQINERINRDERSALADRSRSVDYGITGGPTRTDIDVADGGAESGGGKIVCTMMNERYGFGSFRNKIWMKFHEGYSKDYIKGYHAIFLPLVKIAKGEGKINTAVRKVLEHMGRHVTADMFKIMKGKKRDTLGRIYRAIFEPACHIIGKIKSALGRG
jgi:hypothetical protein